MFGTRAWQLSIDGFSVVTYWSSRNSGCVGRLEAQWSAGQTHFSRGTDFDTTPEHFQLRGHLLTPVLAHFLSLALLHHCGSVSFSVIPVVPPLPGDSKQCLFLFWLHNRGCAFFCAVILVPRVTCIELIYSWMVSFSNSHYTEQSAFTSEGHVKA